MNIIVASTVVIKCAPECIKMQHFEGENTNQNATPPQTTFLDTGLVGAMHFMILSTVVKYELKFKFGWCNAPLE